MGANLSYATVDLAGRVAIVTGSNTGTGYETAKALATMGAKVVMACRTQARAEQAMERMKHEVPESSLDLTFAPLDLSSLKSTADFADWFLGKHDKLNILCCNAGYVATSFEATGDGMERSFQTNYLSHFLLITRLLPLLKTCSPDPRVVSVASYAHNYGKVDLAATHAREAFGQMRTYGTSKLHQILMTGALHRRLKGTGVTVTSVHPGVVKTEFSRASTAAKVFYNVGYAVGAIRNPAEGAATIIHACVNPEYEGQENLYFADCKPTVASAVARNTESQERLFEYSVSLLKDHMQAEGAALLGVDLATVNSPTAGAPLPRQDGMGSSASTAAAVVSPGAASDAASDTTTSNVAADDAASAVPATADGDTTVQPSPAAADETTAASSPAATGGAASEPSPAAADDVAPESSPATADGQPCSNEDAESREDT